MLACYETDGIIKLYKLKMPDSAAIPITASSLKCCLEHITEACFDLIKKCRLVFFCTRRSQSALEAIKGLRSAALVSFRYLLELIYPIKLLTTTFILLGIALLGKYRKPSKY